MELAPISIELWEAFALERKHWDIVDGPTAHLATDRKRFLTSEEYHNPMDVTYTAETFPTRKQAAYFIGCHCMQAALTSVGILHANT